VVVGSDDKLYFLIGIECVINATADVPE
jgi:hypothetical protein